MTLLLVILAAFVACSDKGRPAATNSPAGNVKRLACPNVKAFIVTSAAIGEKLETDPTANQAIAREVADGDRYDSSILIGDEPKNHDETDRRMRSLIDVSTAIRYVMLDADGRVVEEVVVGETPDGWRAVRYDSCG